MSSDGEVAPRRPKKDSRARQRVSCYGDMPAAGAGEMHESRPFGKTALRLVLGERGGIFGDARNKTREAEFSSLQEIGKRLSEANANLISSPKEGVVDVCKRIARAAGYADKVCDSCLRMRIRHCRESAEGKKFLESCEVLANCGEAEEQEEAREAVAGYVKFCQVKAEANAALYGQVAAMAGRAYVFAMAMRQGLRNPHCPKLRIRAKPIRNLGSRKD